MYTYGHIQLKLLLLFFFRKHLLYSDAETTDSLEHYHLNVLPEINPNYLTFLHLNHLHASDKD